jgi:hypothetical protein
MNLSISDRFFVIFEVSDLRDGTRDGHSLHYERFKANHRLIDFEFLHHSATPFGGDAGFNSGTAVTINSAG